jgi:hypothetical protein
MWLAAIGGKVLKLDHSFKLTKRVRDGAGRKSFGAVLTVMNEFCQVGPRGAFGGLRAAALVSQARHAGRADPPHAAWHRAGLPSPPRARAAPTHP